MCKKARFVVETPWGRHRVELAASGAHMAANAAAAIAVAGVVEGAIDDAIGALAGAGVSGMRMEVQRSRSGAVVVNDAYNANPDSMRAALTALQRMGRGRRTWAVLGTMLELGDESEALHAEVGEEAVARGVDELLVVGEPARPLASGATSAVGVYAATTRVRTVADADAAEALLRAELRPGDVALFKSSRDAGLRLLGDRLAAPPEERT